MQLDRPFSLLLVHRDIVATALAEEWLNLPDFCPLELHQVYLIRLDARNLELICVRRVAHLCSDTITRTVRYLSAITR